MSTYQHADHRSVARDAFAQLAELAFDSTSMDAMLQRIAELAKRVIPAVTEASVTLVSNDKAISAAYTGRLALAAVERGSLSSMSAPVPVREASTVRSTSTH